jgi:hypothetical protein
MAGQGKVMTKGGSICLVIGAPITCYLLIARPEIAHIWLEILSRVGGGLIGGGLGLLLFGVLYWLFAGLSSACKMVNRFYDALATEEYLTAFRYLDPSMRTPQGEQITPMWFTRSALLAESVGGLVTDYDLLRFDGQSRNRYFTLKVTRGERSYTTRLHLQRQSCKWKIINFSRL